MSAVAGPAPRAEPAAPDEEAALWAALREVMDPELSISVVDLGLIYRIALVESTAEVELTYTAIACPCAHFIQWDVAERLMREPGVRDVRITEVWHPAWTKARISEEGRRRLKQMGVSL